METRTELAVNIVNISVITPRDRECSGDRKDMSANKHMIDAILPLPYTGKRQIKRVVPQFLSNCRSQQIYEARIVHGSAGPKAERALHEVLKGLPEVACFRTGGPESGSSRATIVVLLGPDELPLTAAQS